MILSFSGYRPSKLGGYKLPNLTYIRVCQATEKLFLELKPEKCISGAAQGFDLYAAFVCIKLGIPFIAAIPHINQEKVWPKESQIIYHKILSKATEVVIVSEGGYTAEKMQKRNEYLVDKADEMIFCIRPDETSGGTYNCLQYAKSKEKTIHYINPDET